MTTTLDFEQICALVEDYFKNHGSEVNYISFIGAENRRLKLLVVNHDSAVELPKKLSKILANRKIVEK